MASRYPGCRVAAWARTRRARTRSLDTAFRSAGPVVEEPEVEGADPLRISEPIDRGDPAVHNDEAHDRHGLRVDRDDDAGRAVHQRRMDDPPRVREPQRRAATACGPRTTADPGSIPRSERRTISGSSTASSASKSPPRAAAKKASTTARWRLGHVPGSAPAGSCGAPDPRAVERPPTSAPPSVRSPPRAPRTCRAAPTPGVRSAAARPGRPGARARPSRPGGLVLGLHPGLGTDHGIENVGVERHLRTPPSAPSRFSRTRGHDGPQPPSEVLDVLGGSAAQPQPRPAARRRRPHSASRASGRRPPGVGADAPRTARPAPGWRPSVTSWRREVSSI